MSLLTILQQPDSANINYLYRFTHEESDAEWAFTSATEDIGYAGSDFDPATIEHESVAVDATEIHRSTVTIRMARSNPLINYIIPGIPDSVISCEIFMIHTPTGDALQIFSGEVIKFSISGAQAVVTCSPVNLELSKSLLHRRYQKLCAYCLYSEGCGVVAEDYRDSGTLTGIDGVELTASVFGTKADDYYTGGYIEIGTEKKMIISHTQSTSKVVLLSGLLQASVGDSFNVYAGCAHDIETCKDKFGNSLNFGGQPYIPDKNVFSGDAISY